MKRKRKRGSYYAGKVGELREERGGRCEACDSTIGLEFAHVKKTPLSGAGRGRGGPQRYRDIRAHPDAYRLLCRICHNDLDLNGSVGNGLTEANDSHKRGKEVPF